MLAEARDGMVCEPDGQERATRRGHHMLAHLRTEAYPVYQRHIYPPAAPGAPQVPALSYEGNNARIDAAKRDVE